MRVLTEEALRVEFKKDIPEKYIVNEDLIVTPAARQYLKEKNVEFIVKRENTEKEDECKEDEFEFKEIRIPEGKITPKYISYYSGGAFEQKPEYMTHLFGNKLVYKDDPRIIFRGKLDSLQSEILELQHLSYVKDVEKLSMELQEVLEYVREILRCEVLSEEYSREKLFGLTEGELRDMSHFPKKYFGVGHILPHYKMDEIMLKLNSLRSSSREVELAAVKAFKKENGIERVDIIKALNRLSSGIYILMCKYKAGEYR
ncbi:cobalamin adenosyltransferase [Anaerosalibacter bizertensis]|uniref:Cobalamin adenosyltransferase n=1 Tax=Anaerosalibacter bizertensis TaxID=932217 RepID=A0A844FKH0_9FIRM|nr:cobalamin adenosyltransferase [Anaerosalibacter bizertensis]MBV1818491.1 hypothetical protein [Bacteroidales bacterium MSK.15.36]HHV26281.1 cobalamin adenosyltransferase [Tissierellia bacterium]MBU5293508.1 hypothetical protein [Anaerosalibacter bizertensis]MCB5559588.1 hypothetical protein [Anaerosalibacter bizertensis]MCG4565527.1 hypothetical protein [Anaerosalibacter bizertensis]